MAKLNTLVAALPDDDAPALYALMAEQTIDAIGTFHNFAISLMQDRPLVAMRLMAWVIDAGPEPSGFVANEPYEQEELRRLHNNATYLAVFHGTPEERRAIVERALLVAAENPAIYHNAACVLCKLGDARAAIETIRAGVASGYDDATIASIREDEDLALISGTEAFMEILEGRGEVVLPPWAEGLSTYQYTQFREAVRTTLADPDMSEFEAGRVTSFGQTFELAGLAGTCRGMTALEITVQVHRHLHGQMR